MEMAAVSRIIEEDVPPLVVASYISGVGMYVPEQVIPNSYFSSYLDTSDEWIRERTGIEERRWAEKDLSVSALAEPACKEAIKNAGLTPADIDGIIFATVTPDYIFPSSGCFLQHRLGIKKGFAFDVNAVCSGFIYALVTADSLIKAGQANNVLVVGAELYSRIINPQDRGTCVLFGDGAGAVVLSKTDENQNAGGVFTPAVSMTTRGLYLSELHSDGAHTNILCVPSGTAKPVTAESIEHGEHYLTMNGREVFKLAVRALVEVSENIMKRAEMTVSDIDWYISHQANKRILSAVGKQLGFPEEKVLMNVQKFGNTSAASLPILLAESSQNGKLKPGDVVMLSAFGGGVTWGAVLLRW